MRAVNGAIKIFEQYQLNINQDYKQQIPFCQKKITVLDTYFDRLFCHSIRTKNYCNRSKCLHLKQ